MAEHDGKPGLGEVVRYAFANARRLGASRRKTAAAAKLCLANMEIGRRSHDDPVRAARIRELDLALIELHKGKWYANEASKTDSRQAWKQSAASFRRASKLGAKLLRALEHGDAAPIAGTPPRLERLGTEIDFADGVPLVPEITPIVVLKGSDFEMGRQYAHQLIDVFGKWILERHAGRHFTAAERETLSLWEEQHRRHTPWVLELCRGWVAGANERGVPATREDVLDLWVGHHPPAKDYLGSGGLPEIPPMVCSGFAAWGRATSDGELVVGATGDHALSYQVTIVAFPERGHSFIYSPFGATGEIGGVGAVWFFGHPAMNDRGLTYVHHGGGPKFLEPRREWGYGIRRAASVIHILRFCDTAREARALEQSWPIGDVGWGDQATVGGFYADGEYAYVMEGRSAPEAVREAGVLGERDFLYANNSVAHPKAIDSEWMSADRDAWCWDEHGGWRPKVPTGMTRSLRLMLAWLTGRLSTSDLLRRGMMFAYTNSCARNRFLFEALDARHGSIDLEAAKRIYRSGGTIPAGSWRAIERAYVKRGEWGRVSVAHSSNAMTVVAKPREGTYCMCTGPAQRGLAPMMPSSTGAIHGETNAFWEIRLLASPEEVLQHARDKARELVERARRRVRGVSALAHVRAWLELAASELAAAEGVPGGASLAELSRAIRASTRAQVRASQVLQATAPALEEISLGVPNQARSPDPCAIG